jgi:hypothetical protein
MPMKAAPMMKLAYSQDLKSQQSAASWRELSIGKVLLNNGWKVLDQYRVPAFHMAEFVDERRGPKNVDWLYKGWSDDKRRRFISALIEVARDNTLIGICGAVAVRDYNEVVPEWLKRETQHPYHLSLQNFFDNVLTTLQDSLPLLLLPWERIAFSFEQQDEFEKKALELFSQVRKRDHQKRLGSIVFVPKGKFRAHEAADLFAFRMRKVITRLIAGKKPFARGGWDEQLNARKSLIVGYFTRPNLEQ